MCIFEVDNLKDWNRDKLNPKYCKTVAAPIVWRKKEASILSTVLRVIENVNFGWFSNRRLQNDLKKRQDKEKAKCFFLINKITRRMVYTNLVNLLLVKAVGDTADSEYLPGTYRFCSLKIQFKQNYFKNRACILGGKLVGNSAKMTLYPPQHAHTHTRLFMAFIPSPLNGMTWIRLFFF